MGASAFRQIKPAQVGLLGMVGRTVDATRAELSANDSELRQTCEAHSFRFQSQAGPEVVVTHRKRSRRTAAQIDDVIRRDSSSAETS